MNCLNLIITTCYKFVISIFSDNKYRSVILKCIPDIYQELFVSKFIWPNNFMKEKYLTYKQQIMYPIQKKNVFFVSCNNPFQPNISFLYPLKTSENLWFSDVFRGYRNGILARKGLIKNASQNLPDTKNNLNSF